MDQQVQQNQAQIFWCDHFEEVPYNPKGFYSNNQVIVIFCSNCDLENVTEQIYLFEDLMKRQLETNGEQSNQLEVLQTEMRRIIHETEVSLRNVNKQVQGIQNVYKQDNIILQQSINKITNGTPLAMEDCTNLINMAYNNINRVNSKIYNLFNIAVEKVIQSITDQNMEVYNVFEKMSKESPSTDIDLIFFSTFDRNLTYFQLKLNQLINGETLKLKMHIEDTFRNNSILEPDLQFIEKLDLFNYQIESNQYFLKDIDKLFNDIKKYLEESQIRLKYKNQLQEQLEEGSIIEIQQEVIPQRKDEVSLVYFNENESQDGKTSLYDITEKEE